jgi:hypothetical protein
MSIEDLDEEMESEGGFLPWPCLEEEDESCRSKLGSAGAGEIGLDE